MANCGCPGPNTDKSKKQIPRIIPNIEPTIPIFFTDIYSYYTINLFNINKNSFNLLYNTHMSNFWQKLPKPFFILAPMEDVTDFAFREVVATVLPRPHVLFTEFTSADALDSKGRESALRKFKFSENQRPIVAQIWGSTPEKMFKAAQTVSELDFDGVDLNMGCPERKVVKSGLGCALSDTPELAKEMIQAVKEGAPDLPISVKTRLGNKKNIADTWIPFLLEQNLAALTIHGRIGKQMSEGLADWEQIGKAVKWRDVILERSEEREAFRNEAIESHINKTLIIGNGDVKSVIQGKELSEKYGVDGVMIGRGIFHNPWVFEEIQKEHSKEEYIEVLKKHLQIFDETWKDTKNFAIMKKFCKMYINGFQGASELRAKLMESKSYEELRGIISTFA
jgi:tRNA-dihydrouridine synthase